ncbi:GntR family transcriptional regulator [Cytobacillus oceanisediminis]|uniref:GntR family transcriptional regulator n=1 Tax=Cytobacillus oceanisediminis TaxID=665099 RepID=A0A2V2ZLB0_9BACI|nr:GntR family transcriptional regulator [Cytobacillus oceanisediminis]PWW17641.1 GntR family transcriptional regulator [Cytobacillus oceanisediminis]
MNRMIRDEEDVPFYKQLKNKILDEIESGKLKHGDKLPSERELAEQFQISRMTARHTLSILEREGVVERRVGSGTFINNNKIQLDFVTFNSFTKNMLSKGLIPSTQILSIRKMEATPNLAQKLKLPLGENMIAIQRLRHVNETPISIEESFLPEKLCPRLDEIITDNDSLYEILEREYGVVLVMAKEFMQITVSDESESKLLKIRSESPCIFQEAVAFDTNEKEIEFSTSLTRSDIVKFYSELKLK